MGLINPKAPQLLTAVLFFLHLLVSDPVPGIGPRDSHPQM